MPPGPSSAKNLKVSRKHRLVIPTLVVLLAACSTGSPPGAATPTPTDVATPTTHASPTVQANDFPTELFAGLGDAPVSEALAAELQAVLEASASGAGLTAMVISPQGTWVGATGIAAADRQMVPSDQMSIASITKTLVAAQVMQMVEMGELALDDLAADHLPSGLEFDTNGATIENLLSMRSGIPDYFADEDELSKVLITDPGPLHVWTLEEKLATVAPERRPAGQDQAWEYIGTNYLLLGLIIEQVTGRSVAQVLRTGVLAGGEYERLIYQPDERPIEPMAMARTGSTDTFDDNGGFLPSIANSTMFTSEGAMASDALSLAQWFRSLCAGEVVSPATLNEMTDFETRPEYGLGIIDRRGEYGWDSGALGHTGYVREGGRTAALCFQDPGLVVVVLANEEHDTDTTAGALWRAAR